MSFLLCLQYRKAYLNNQVKTTDVCFKTYVFRNYFLLNVLQHTNRLTLRLLTRENYRINE